MTHKKCLILGIRKRIEKYGAFSSAFFEDTLNKKCVVMHGLQEIATSQNWQPFQSSHVIKKINSLTYVFWITIWLAY